MLGLNQYSVFNFEVDIYFLRLKTVRHVTACANSLLFYTTSVRHHDSATIVMDELCVR